MDEIIKFAKLYAGDWEGLYFSQSDADLALVKKLYEMTSDRQETIILFRQSKLGKRAKAQREDYLNNMLDVCCK